MTRNRIYTIGNNLVFLTKNHIIIVTPNHIKNLRNITNLTTLSAILYEDHILHEKIKKNKNRRKGRI